MENALGRIESSKERFLGFVVQAASDDEADALSAAVCGQLATNTLCRFVFYGIGISLNTNSRRFSESPNEKRNVTVSDF